MGQDKALLVLDGQAMAARVADALARAGAEPAVAIGGDGHRLQALGLEVVPDEHPGAGPLAAVITALGAGDAAVVLVVACDLRHPSPATMRAVVEALAAAPSAAVAVPVAAGRAQWAHAAWRREALAPLRTAWASGVRSLHAACAGLVVVEVHDLPVADLRDADVPADLDQRGTPRR